ncbi:hypothetical protein A4H97_22805 [Niastella yeongjuensis]|uniref:HTH araC/xylS-type domain-containing protein n=1 Tax=Niastella yeongjuensis TaxID=354355 RepID=A0A1V9F7U8_9BACT|nr:AraC family transcriptional regulator [Niastella yeongjuensis]OQP54317.1 hypothetical protein A4H97_22805 [Niastella yeongjuensis]SEP30346.1 AraC-type DNA-binding protein [Niastella yeongjuensis]
MKKNNHSLYVLTGVEAIKQHLDNNPFEYRTSSELLNKVSEANRKSVEKAFKDIYGCGIKTYHVKQRLEKSKQFLEAGRSIKLVAGACLYKSQSAYSTAFKKAFNITPTQWLKNVCAATRKKLSKS